MGTSRHWVNPFAEQTWGVLMFQLFSHYQAMLVRSWCTNFMYIMEFSWNCTFGSEGKEQNWTEWETEKPSRTTHSPGDPTGSSGTRMTLQEGSKLNQNGHALISPSLLIISSWIWAAPCRSEMWVGLLSTLIEYLKGWRAKAVCQQHSQHPDLSLMGMWAEHNLVPAVLYACELDLLRRVGSSLRHPLGTRKRLVCSLFNLFQSRSPKFCSLWWVFIAPSIKANRSGIEPITLT